MNSIRLQAYEHDRLVVGNTYATSHGKAVFEECHFEALAKYHDRTETKAFKLQHHAIKLCHYVGCLRVGPVSLEIYPKLGRDDQKLERWRELLLHMIKVVAGVRFAAQENAPLKSRSGDLFDLLIERFLLVTQALLREGLVRSYREIEENSTTFRGRLLAGQHFRENLVRKERIYVAYEIQDTDNLPNRILHRALERILRTTANLDFLHQVEEILLEFPEVSTSPVRESEWSILDRLNRHTLRYKEGLTLARLILREERPDLKWGKRDVISLLFDMNVLFEGYLDAAFRGMPGCVVKSQKKKAFWIPETGANSSLKPDLLVHYNGQPPIIVDAKWKILHKTRPDDADLRQVYVYLHAFNGTHCLLAYPKTEGSSSNVPGRFLEEAFTGKLVFLDLFPKDEKPDLASFRANLQHLLKADP